MKFYLAASFRMKAKMRSCARLLEERGHTVTGDWFQAEGPEVNFNSVEAEIRAVGDYKAVREADALVLFTSELSSTGGYHVELGIALTLGKSVYLIGPRRNIFMALPAVRQFVKWEPFFDYVKLILE